MIRVLKLRDPPHIKTHWSAKRFIPQRTFPGSRHTLDGREALASLCNQSLIPLRSYLANSQNPPLGQERAERLGSKSRGALVCPSNITNVASPN